MWFKMFPKEMQYLHKFGIKYIMYQLICSMSKPNRMVYYVVFNLVSQAMLNIQMLCQPKKGYI